MYIETIVEIPNCMGRSKLPKLYTLQGENADQEKDPNFLQKFSSLSKLSILTFNHSSSFEIHQTLCLHTCSYPAINKGN